MRIQTIFMSALCGLLSLSSSAQVSNNNEDGVYKVDKNSQRAYRQGEVIVKFKSDGNVRRMAKGKFKTSSVSAVDAVLKELGAQEIEPLMPLTGELKAGAKRRVKAFNGNDVEVKDLSKLYTIRLDASKQQSIYAVKEKLEALDEVEFAEPNYLVYIQSSDECESYDDPLFYQQTNLTAVNLPQLWTMPKITNKRPVIAILDTGVDITHPDLAANIWTNPSEDDGMEGEDDDDNGFADDIHGWDFVLQSPNMRDRNGHGTHCAGIAAAVGNNGIGIVGANPDALIMPIVVMQSDGTGDIATIIKGVDYAVANGADVLSMSLGTYQYSIAMEQALGHAYADAVLVAAAGNDGKDIYPEHLGTTMFPAAFTFVLGVQATDASFSNFDCDGPTFSTFGEEKLYNYEISAPGTQIMSTYPQGKYKALSGTSMACPLVAGAVSRLYQCKEIDSKEILFGDLIHTSQVFYKNRSVSMLDILAAYNIKDEDRTPELEFVGFEMSDAEGDADGRYDAGEVVEIYPTIRNVWGHAENVRYSIELANELEDPDFVEFLVPETTLGRDLDGYTKAKGMNPLRIRLSDKCVDGQHLQFRIKGTCDKSELDFSQDYSINVENGIELGGILHEDLELFPDKNYIITKNLGITEGVTLKMMPGSKLTFKNSATLSIDGNFIAVGTPEKPIIIRGDENYSTFGAQIITSYNNFILNYAIVSGFSACRDGYLMTLWQHQIGNYENGEAINTNIDISDCVFSNNGHFQHLIESYTAFRDDKTIIHRCNLFANSANFGLGNSNNNCYMNNCNIINNDINCWGYIGSPIAAGCDMNCNIYGNSANMWYETIHPSVFIPDYPSYWGSATESIIRKNIYDMYNENSPIGFGEYSLANMLNAPSKEAHGIVWKVVVNDKDTQDEFDELPPLGVGKHKFEVYFNRPMDKSVTPSISMGVRPPYTQTLIAEDGAWNENGTIYTAYLNITGKSSFDGLNRIRVHGAEDNEHFEIPEEQDRFNVMVQKTGSMSTGLMAETGLGKVKLTWETDEESFADLMGYNVYRYTEKEEKYWEWVENEKGEWRECEKTRIIRDTIMVNTSLIEPNETEFTDYDVIPGTTYYYLIREIGTDLVQHDVSNVVAATPLTATKGDANGSMSVDIADVVTEVAYLTDQNPQPFIFDAADVNEDQTVNILDVVGTVNIIMSPSVTSQSVDNTVTYTIEDGILYVESTTPLGGVQVSVNADAKKQPLFATLEGLDGMEHAGTWLNDNEYMLLAYSMSGKTIATGKQPLLQIGDKEVKNMIVSDARGRNLVAINGTATSIEELPFGIDECENAEVRYFDTTGRAVSASAATKKGVYIVGMYVDGKCVKSYKLLNR